MRVRIEKTFVTTASGTRVVETQPESFEVEAQSLADAVVEFIQNDGGRLLGTPTEKENRVVATAWKNRVYLVCAEPAPD
ncbi:MAG TPA: hypothetical protein VFT12_14935 [Thermoanaerobaculia bacterium]|nr:hypothetical protein [Thermoanaerobaculia bacterium]